MNNPNPKPYKRKKNNWEGVVVIKKPTLLSPKPEATK